MKGAKLVMWEGVGMKRGSSWRLDILFWEGVKRLTKGSKRPMRRNVFPRVRKSRYETKRLLI